MPETPSQPDEAHVPDPETEMAWDQEVVDEPTVTEKDPLDAAEPTTEPDSQPGEPTDEEIATKGIARFLSRSPFLQHAWEETKESAWHDKPLLLVSAGGLWFNYGPGNEWLATKVGTETIQHMAEHGTQWMQETFTGADQFSLFMAEHGNIILTSGTTGAALALTSLVTHGAFGKLMLRNLRKYPEAVKALREGKLGQSDFLQNSEDRSPSDRFQNAFFIGTDSVMFEDAVTDEAVITDIKKGDARVWSTTRLISYGTFALGVVGGGVAQAYINNGNPEAADAFLNFVGNPWLWLGGITLSRGYKYAKRRSERRKEEAAEQAASEEKVFDYPEAIEAQVVDEDSSTDDTVHRP